jgi:hypothetical protein
MVPRSVIDRTIEPFTERTAERQQTLATLRTGSLVTANDPVRVERLARLAMTESARRPSVADVPVTTVSVPESAHRSSGVGGEDRVCRSVVAARRT